MRHTRRKFLATTLTVLATGGLSCGGGEADNFAGLQAGPDCLSNGAEVNLGTQSHTMRVPAEDVRAGVEKSYNIQGTDTHAHFVTLTAEHFAALRANQSITLNSTTDVSGYSNVSHNHRAIVQCI